MENINQLLPIQYLFIHPMLYVGLIIILLQYKRQIALERKLFSSKLHSLSSAFYRSLGYGILGGIIASSLMVGMGIIFHPAEMWLVWLITLILALFHVRFLCLSYATGILGMLAGIIQWFDIATVSWLMPFMEIMKGIHIPSFIAIVAILHLVEAILIRIQMNKQATPLFIETKRGKLIGGYHIQSFWLLPLFLVVSTGMNQQGLLFSDSWWPLIGSTTGFTLLPVPVMIGYTDLTTTYTPIEKSKSAYHYLLIYSILLLIMAFIAEYWLPFQFVAAIFAGLAHEGIRIIGKRKEKDRTPLYVHPKDGLTVLAVIPGSLAARMGLQIGEVIKKVNGDAVVSRRELYDALQK